MRKPKSILLLALLTLGAPLFGADLSKELIGSWEVVRQDGFNADKGEIEYTFNKDGTATMEGELGDLDIERDFSYTLAGNYLVLNDEKSEGFIDFDVTIVDDKLVFAHPQRRKAELTEAGLWIDGPITVLERR